MVKGKMDLSRVPVFRAGEKIRHNQVGADGKCKVAAICDFFQNAAAEHAEVIGVGITFLKKQSMAWMLSRLHVEVVRYPDLEEAVEIVTYPSGFERLFALRQFAMLDSAGEVIAKASSAWLLIDTERFRPLRAASALEVENAECNSGLPVYFNVSGKLPATVPDDFQLSRSAVVAVQHSDIDLNKHMNNAVYVARMSDVLDGAQPREFDLAFLRSMTVDAKVEYSAWKNDELEFFVSGKCDGNDCFAAAGLLQPTVSRLPFEE